MFRRIALPVALVAAIVGSASLPATAHGDIPESDVACTGPALLNDDLAPRAASGSEGHVHRVVSARAEILDANGSAVGTFYLDDRGERYVTFEPAATDALLADFPTAGPAPAGAPAPLARDFTLNERYRLAACR